LKIVDMSDNLRRLHGLPRDEAAGLKKRWDKWLNVLGDRLVVKTVKIR